MPTSAITVFDSNTHRIYDGIYNYIYLHHTGTFLIIPTYPENMSDSMSTSFSPTTILGRSAPIQTYGGSGPRTLNVTYKLHRDMMQQVNQNASNAILNAGDDYIDAFIKEIQAAALPTYVQGEKMIDPPMASLRIGPEIYIKGVVGRVGVDYSGSINRNDKYTLFNISFDITEVQPYDAFEVLSIGSYRDPGDLSLDTSLDRDIYIGGSSWNQSGIRGTSGYGNQYNNIVNTSHR